MEISPSEEEAAIREVVQDSLKNAGAAGEKAFCDSGLDQIFSGELTLRDLYFIVESLGSVVPTPFIDAIINHFAVSYLCSHSEDLNQLVSSIPGGLIGLAHAGPRSTKYLWHDRISRVLLVGANSTSIVSCPRPNESLEHPALNTVVQLADAKALKASEASLESSKLSAEIMATAQVFHAIRMSGAAKRLMDMTVEFVQVREQFNRPVGSFQAVQHELADAYVECEAMRAVTQLVSWEANTSLRNGEALPLESMTQAFRLVTRNYFAASKRSIQLHGGIGFSWEYELHRHFKRAVLIQQLFDDAGPLAVPESHTVGAMTL